MYLLFLVIDLFYHTILKLIDMKPVQAWPGHWPGQTKQKTKKNPLVEPGPTSGFYMLFCCGKGS